LAAIDPAEIPLLEAALKGAGGPAFSTLSRLDVVDIAKIAPNILIADVDELDVDPLEMLRRLRFVLPECVIVVYTSGRKLSWARSCHLTGVNCLLSKGSSEAQLTTGLRRAMLSGCYTDPLLAG
jgi:DNA-binding NarL/FixJ family response regulator